MTEREPKPELSRPIAPADLSTVETRIELVATQEECAALAGRFSLLALSGLRAVVGLLRQERHRQRLDARIDPRIDRSRRHRLLVDVRGEHRTAALPPERRVAGDHVIEDAANRVEVRSRIDVAAAGALLG